MYRQPRFADYVHTLACALACAGVALQAQSKGQPRVEEMLSRAITLYATDSASTETEKLLLQVPRMVPRNSIEADTATYYLGRYYHRNYYMLKQPDALEKAIDRYKDIHVQGLGSERRGARYADARFYKGLAYLELGRWKDAYEAVDHLEPELDSRIELDYLVWRLDKQTLNVEVPSATLKQQYLAIANQFNIRSLKNNQRDAKTVSAMLAALSAKLQQVKRTGR